VVISQATPTISTTQQPASAALGASIADQATVSGGYFLTGTVTFNLYDNPKGTGTPLFCRGLAHLRIMPILFLVHTFGEPSVGDHFLLQLFGRPTANAREWRGRS
jgi:hypothetical protein